MQKKQASGREEDELEALRQSESRLRLILENTSDGINIAEFDPRTSKRRLLMCNDRYVEMAGRSREELMAADDLNQLVAWTTYRGPTFLEQIKKGLPSEGTSSWLRPDGKENCYDWTAAPLKVGDKYHIIGIDRGVTERRKAEEKLRRLAMIAEQVGEGVAVADLDGVLQFVNAAWAKMHGYETERELAGKHLSVFHTPEQMKTDVIPFNKQVKRKGHHKGQVWHVRRDGTPFPMEMTVTLFKDEGGNPIGLAAFAIDVTERRQAEEALLESESKYRLLLENLPQMIFYKDRNSVYVSCNENFARSAKIKPEEISGKTDYDFFPKELADKYRTDDKRIMASGKAEDIEEKFLGVGKEKEVFVHIVKTPIRDSKGDVVGILGIFWDITEHKRADEALRESEKTMRAILDATLDSVLTIEPDGTILAVNDTAARGFGKSASELVGMNVRDTLRHDLAQQRLAQSDEVVRSGKPLRFVDEHDGLWLDHSVYPIFDSKGRVVRLAIFARDITESKKAEEALRESEKTARALLNATQDLALMIDPDGTLLAVNEIAAKAFGKAPSKIIGKNVRDTFRPDLAEQRLAQSNEVVRSGKPLRFEDEHDGMWLDHSVYPVFDAEGKVARLAIFASNITERKKAEEALRKSEHDLRKRVRELNCLYQVTEVVNTCGDSLDALLEGITDILPELCQHPEKACARITFGEKKYETGNFRESPWKLAADILVAGEKAGAVEVFCLKEKPDAGEGPFLKEERSLIDTIAARIGRNIERIQNRQRLLAEQSALHEKNIALREVMDGIQDEKKEISRRVVSNVEKIIMPLLYALERELSPGQRKYVDLLKGGLEDITLPFADRLSQQFASLTPTEIRICNLIRRGLSTKEIAGLQHVSPATVNKHREHIRRKLQIMNKDVNLATYLENYMSGLAET